MTSKTKKRLRKSKVKQKQGVNKPNPKHKRDFEELLDLAVKGQK